MVSKYHTLKKSALSMLSQPDSSEKHIFNIYIYIYIHIFFFNFQRLIHYYSLEKCKIIKLRLSETQWLVKLAYIIRISDYKQRKIIIIVRAVKRFEHHN